MAIARKFRRLGEASLLLGVGLLLAGPGQVRSQEPVASQDAFTVPGTVSDAQTGDPLQYAVVGFPELGAWGLSDADGAFSLVVPAVGTYQLVVVKRGWYLADHQITLAGPQTLDIQLYPEEKGDAVGPGRLVGRVLQAGSSRPVSGATVRISPTNQETRTDSRGRFLISGISAGAIRVEVDRRGSTLRTDTLAAFPGVTLAVEIAVSDDPSTRPDVVVEVWPQYLESVGFLRRAESRRGNRFGRAYLEDRGSSSRLSDIISSAVPSLRAEPGRFGNRVLTTRATGGGRCALGIYLDNSYMPGFDIDSYPVSWVEAFETYEGLDVPMEYNHPCGVVLLWTRGSR
jgi:hypothetical protein